MIHITYEKHRVIIDYESGHYVLRNASQVGTHYTLPELIKERLRAYLRLVEVPLPDIETLGVAAMVRNLERATPITPLDIDALLTATQNIAAERLRYTTVFNEPAPFLTTTQATTAATNLWGDFLPYEIAIPVP